MEKKILVIGGKGFIGTNLCRKFAELGAKVIILDDLQSYSSEFNDVLKRILTQRESVLY